MIPQTRTDLFLAKITGEDVALPVPQTRFELYLANIAGESYELPAPNSRATLYLAKILGQDVALPVPQTRSELYLAAIAGMSVQLPAVPTTREEWYLARWAEDAAYVTITGNPVSFTAVAAKLRQLKIAFSPVQEGSGDPSPENERPIHGWTGVNVWQAGKNLFDASRVQWGYWLSNTWHDNVIWGGILIPCQPGTTISVSGNPTGGGVSAVWLNQWNDCTTGLVANTGGYVGVTTFTAPEGAYGLWLPLYKGDDWSALQIEYAASPTAYEAPTDRLIPVVFPDGKTYYSGWVDLITGLMRVTHKSRTFSGNDSWNGSNTGINANLSISDMASGSHYSDPFAICDTLPKVSVISGTTPEVRIGASNTSVYLYNMSSVDASITSSATLNTYLASHPIMITYPLAEPITIQLTPQQINSLAGANNMWSDANGDLTVEYWKDGNVSDAEALSLLLGGRYSPAQDPDDVPDREALRIITGR